MWHNTRFLNVLTALLCLGSAALLLTLVVRWGIHQPQFVLRRITIEAAPGAVLQHINLPSLRASAVSYALTRTLAGTEAGRGTRATIQTRDNFFQVNLEQVRTAFESVPWVRHASVRRQWPNRLVVTLEEHHPLATWSDGRLVNTYGELFSANPEEIEDDLSLPEFSGPTGSEKQLTQRYRDLLAWLQPIQRRPQKIILSERYAWQVVLDDNTRLELGREQTPDILQQRVQRYVAALPPLKTKLAQHFATVDLRYPNGFAVRGAGLRVPDELSTAATKS